MMKAILEYSKSSFMVHLWRNQILKENVDVWEFFSVIWNL